MNPALKVAPRAVLALAEELAAEGHDSAARGLTELVIAAEPELLAAHRLLARLGPAGEPPAPDAERETAAACQSARAAIAANEPVQALAVLDALLARSPRDVRALVQRGGLHRSQGRAAAALADADAALAVDPHYVDALTLRLALRQAQGDLTGALEDADRAVAARAHPITLSNRGGLRKKRGDIAGALADFDAAIAAGPTYAPAHAHRAIALKILGRWSESRQAFAKALALEPSGRTRFNLAQLDLLEGRYHEGWAGYEHRWDGREQHRPRLAGTPWDGRPTRKHLLCYGEQGIGDTLMFIRYPALLAQQGMRVTAWLPGVMRRLLRGLPGELELLDNVEGPPPHDVHVSMLSLPGLLGADATTIPQQRPRVGGVPPQAYIVADPARMERWRPRLARLGGAPIGVVWQGNPAHENDVHRSIALRELAPLASVPGVRLVSLQKGHGTEQMATCGFPVTDLGPELDADGMFLDTAAVMSCLPLVITVDTAAAHLAGALGRPTWLLLASAPDWRWGYAGEKTPWYPTLTLMRQRRLGDWSHVIRAAATRLAGHVSGAASGPRAEPLATRTHP